MKEQRLKKKVTYPILIVVDVVVVAVVVVVIVVVVVVNIVKFVVLQIVLYHPDGETTEDEDNIFDVLLLLL